MVESKEELKTLLRKVKEESEKPSLKLSIHKTKIMASCPITSWHIHGETVADFIFEGLANHCRWWLQPWNQKTLTPWKESYDQPREHIKKQRHYFADKCLYSQSYDFSSGHGCESWTIKKAVRQRIDGFELWCWRRLSRVPWTARRPNQSILKGISPGCSLEGLMLKFWPPWPIWPPHAKSWLVGKDPDAGRDWGQEEKGTTEDEMAGWHHRFNAHE